MQICFFAHNLNQDNGAGVFSYRLIAGLQEELGAEVVAFTSEKSHAPFENALLSGGFFRNYFAIRRIIKKCDVVHALDAYPYGVMAWLLLLGMRKKFIITAIGTGAILHLYKPFHAFFLRLAYRKATRVTTVSEFSKREIVKKVRNLPIAVITHGVDAAFWRDEKGSEAIKKRILRFMPYIISVGSLRARKGFDLSIRSFAKVKEQIPGLKYVIVGKRYGNYYEKIKKLVHELKLERDIFFIQDIDDPADVAELYRHAELFCLMSKSMGHDVEAFGLVFLEAAAAGLPVIGTYDGGVRDATDEGKNAVLVDVKDIKPYYKKMADPLSAAIISILKDGARRKNMSEFSLSLAERSDWSIKIRRYKEMYNTL